MNITRPINNSSNQYLPIMKKNPKIPDGLIRFLESNKPIVFYGNGNQGVVCEETLVDALKFQIDGFVKSNEYKNVPNRYSQLPSCLISELSLLYTNKECQIVIALNYSDSLQVYEKLLMEEYKEIFICEDWEIVNLALREIRFQALLEEYGIKFDETSKIFEYKNFRFNNPYTEDHNYLTFFLGEFGELVAPHIFGDFSLLRTEGPYCYKNVDIENGDVVLDLGANIGLFSASAASKGCKVFSFEPIDFVANHLRKTARLYDGSIEIIESAVCDRDGTIEFSKVPEDFHDIGESSILNRGDSFDKILVTSITIDTFVKEKGLQSVDFIKADIEGAERQMIKGARKTLANFAPKLAICTYHLPNDKEVLTQLILEANPKYHIEYQWEKLYAYVPNTI